MTRREVEICLLIVQPSHRPQIMDPSHSDASFEPSQWTNGHPGPLVLCLSLACILSAIAWPIYLPPKLIPKLCRLSPARLL
ncbi:hypothetical protein BU24DRAFT_418140, partial [Aaosphaeria arxii CBS 175.79]